MKLQVTKNVLDSLSVDVLILGIFSSDKNLSPKVAKIDEQLNSVISHQLKKKRITAEQGAISVYDTLNTMQPKKVMILGLGDQKDVVFEVLRKTIAKALKQVRSLKQKTVAICIDKEKIPFSSEDFGVVIAEAVYLGLYTYSFYKKENKSNLLQSVTVCLNSEKESISVKKGIANGTVLCDAVTFTRDLVNHPSNFLTTEKFAQIAQKTAKECKLSCTVFTMNDLKKMKMGQIIAVGQGSHIGPRLVILEYKGAPGKKDKLGLVGKGITFDSGGISIKPANGMDEMKTDMAGAASVLGIMKAVSKLKPKVNIMALLPLAENMPGGGAFRPGDIITGVNGETVEVLTTDAEGRMVMADAICYAETKGCSTIIDIATLTGAARVALGQLASALFSRNGKMAHEVLDAAEAMGEKLWRMPLYDEYKDLLKSDVADIRNVGLRAGGAITAALFLEFFVKKAKWMHIDIAGPAYYEKGTEYIAKGASGVPLRTLVQWIAKVYK